jgi:DNA-binding NtrC family response regulator
LRIRVPPLRHRLEDVPDLTHHLLCRIAGDQPYKIDDSAVQLLCQHHWPGNVRELYHTLERAWLVGGGHISADLLGTDLGLDDLADSAAPWDSAAQSVPDVARRPSGFKAAMEHAEKQLLVEAMERSGGNKTAAAQALRMKPSTFRDKLSKHGLG